MRQRRKSVVDISTMNSPKVGRRKKQTYLQLHTLANRRQRLKDELQRLKVRQEKAEESLKEVNDYIQTLLKKTEDINSLGELEDSSKSSNPGSNNHLTY